jgi:hypothetical protein
LFAVCIPSGAAGQVADPHIILENSQTYALGNQGNRSEEKREIVVVCPLS